MNAPLQNLTLATIATLLAAATLALLHRLRAQPVRRPVATLLFWQTATREQASRVLWGRFSRLATLLFLLAIVGLLGVALSGAQGIADRRAPRVLVIDAGYAMSAADDGGRTRSDEASALASSEADDRPLAVIEAGDVPRLLASFDDPPIAAHRAIATIRPTSRPADRAAAIRLAVSLLPRAGESGGGEIVLYTDRPLPRDRLPSGVDDVLRVRTVGRGPARNRAIVSAIYSSSAPGLGLGTLVVRTIARGDLPPASRVRLTMLDGEGAETQVIERDAIPLEGGEAVATFDELAADGRRARVDLAEPDAIAADDRVLLHLPAQPPIAFDIADPPLPAALAAALSSLGSADADARRIAVATLDAQASTATERPAIALVRGDGVAAGLRVAPSDDELMADLRFEGAVVGRGAALSSPSATPLLRAGDAVVAAIERDGGATRLLLSDALFADGATLPRRPAFAVMLARAARRMAGWTDAPLNLALDRQVEDPAWADGRDDDNVALLAGSRQARDVAATRPTETEPPALERSPGIGRVWVIALSAAIALLAVEGLLYATKRIV